VAGPTILWKYVAFGAQSKFYKRARTRRRECQRGEHLWRQRQTAGIACGHRPMGAARLRAQQQRSEWAQRARVSAGFQPAFRETPAAHSLSFSLSFSLFASNDFSYVSVLPARLPGSVILALILEPSSLSPNFSLRHM
jgi:hypothetical protein